MTLDVIQVPQQDHRLGRHVAHDSRSRAFPMPFTATRPTKPFRHRMYGPRVTPEQFVGNCTTVAECVMANTRGNRVRGEVLDMADAMYLYGRATRLDPFPGQYLPDDTGSDGLSAWKSARADNITDRCEWAFGIDHLLDRLPYTPQSVGIWWPGTAFSLDPEGYLDCSGSYVGGHQWVVFGYEPATRTRDEAVWGLCWWGPNWPTPGGHGRFRMRVTDLARLLADQGDCHTSIRTATHGVPA